MSKADLELLYQEVASIIEALQPGTVFLAKDPFDGTKWKALNRGDKLGYGRYFKNLVLNNKVADVEYLGKADNNSSQYVKSRKKDS